MESQFVAGIYLFYPAFEHALLRFCFWPKPNYESASHDGAPILCVAGLIFKKSEAIKLGHEWAKVLRWKKLPYFHMVECAHGNGEFAKLSKDERIEVARRMVCHQARTQTITHYTNLTRNRLATLRRRWSVRT